MSTLERAIAIAAEAHAGTLDKAGAAYILHPLRVMLAVKNPDEQVVAVLHDVVEDCEGWSFVRLREEGFGEAVIEGLRSVTKTHEDEDYDLFIDRAMANAIGRVVKLADLNDNCDLSRLANPTEKDHRRIQKYRRSIARIEASMA